MTQTDSVIHTSYFINTQSPNELEGQNYLLSVDNLSTSVDGVTLIDEVSFHIKSNQTVGIVGESGSGKSTLGLSLLKLVGGQKNTHYQGTINFSNRDILKISEPELRQLRGREISMVLQDPMTSLDPVFTIKDQIAEAIQCHGKVTSQELRERIIGALTKVKIPHPEHRAQSFPHQLSGGMRQRVVGAIAISCAPKLLIADEPTTSLDATIQAQFLQLLEDIQAETGMSIMIITHDFGVIAKMCHRVCVMYAGNIVESASVDDIFDAPSHPYTKALIASRPQLDQKPKRLESISGSPPKPTDKLSGCKFAPRCNQAKPRCFEEMPPVTSMANEHDVRCWYPIGSENL